MKERKTFEKAAFELIAMRFILEADVETKREFATFEDTPPAILAKLAEDKDVFVLENVATNPNTPITSLAELVEFEGYHVSKYARENLKSRTKKVHD